VFARNHVVLDASNILCEVKLLTQTSQIENSPYTLKNLHWYQIKKQEEVYWDEIDLNAY
jgi:hypothetical protein